MTTARRYLEQMFLDIWGDEFYHMMEAMNDDEIMAYIVEVGQLGYHLATATTQFHTNTLRISLGAYKRNKQEQEMA